jgi:PAS domain-containing protein
MPDNSFYHPAPPNPGAGETLWLPLLAASALFLVDFYLIPGIFALPLLLLILLIFLAFRLPAWTVAAWTVIFAIVVLIIRLSPIQEAITLPALKPYTLTAVFLTGGAGSILFAAYRRRLEMGHDALFRIISGLPLAVIVSDISGRILLLNEQAQQVLKNHIADPAGVSFFSTFVSPSDQGKTVAAYISYFDPAHVGTVTTVLRTRGAPELILHAAITVVAIGNQRYAITVVERVEAVAAEGS